MTHRLDDKVKRRAASMGTKPPNDKKQERPETTETETEPPQTLHIHYFPDAIVILKEQEQEAQVVDSQPVVSKKGSMIPAYVFCCFYVLLIVFVLAFELDVFFNPPVAIVTITLKSQMVIFNGTLQLGRVLPILTISQSQVSPATGKGHQDSKTATGVITFYNGEFQSVTIVKGTILTGASGIKVVTDQDATIPPGNPPNYGQIRVPAHALYVGIKGNIPADDISLACCATSVFAKNTTSFTGGQNERYFSTVSPTDINKISTQLHLRLKESMQAALQSQLQPEEQLYLLSCLPTVTSNHQIGQEATTVNVTVSETCRGVAYNKMELLQKATDRLSYQAAIKFGTGYSLSGKVKISVNQATMTHTSPPLVFLAISVTGTWVYTLGKTMQQQIKRLIAGKNTAYAAEEIMSLPGVEHVSIHFAGIIDTARLPESGHILLVVFAP